MAEARSGAPLLPVPWVFLLLTLGLAVCHGLATRGGTGAGRPPLVDALWRWLTLIAAGGMLAVAVAQLQTGDALQRPLGPTAGPSAGRITGPAVGPYIDPTVNPITSSPSAGAAVDTVGIEAALQRLLARREPALIETLSLVQQEDAWQAGSGILFRDLDRWRADWREVADGDDAPVLGLILRRDGQNVAWTADAEPLTGDGQTAVGRQGRYLLHFRDLPAGYDLEIQLRLDRTRGESLPPQGTFGRDQARRFIILLTCWAMALAGVGRALAGSWGLYLCLWTARIAFAVLEFFQWFVPSFPDWEFPADPRSVASLVDPAYFATPFAQGLFASTADALLTVFLLAVTVKRVVMWRVSMTDGDRKTRHGLSGRAPVTALVFGLVCGGLLLAVRFFAAEVADNANPRLIGVGIPSSFLSFWGLHLVLMLGALAVVALPVGLAPVKGLPTRRELPLWLGLFVLAGLGGLLATATTAGLWWGARAALALVVAGLWSSSLVIGAGSRLLGRLGWPLVLALTVIWNYASLREVYDLAERGWLQRKSQVITESREDWMRYLLEDALLEMRQSDDVADGDGRETPAESVAPAAADRTAAIWRDEAAYRHWRESALQDLGLSTLLEVIDQTGNEESLFAAGFMRDTHYELQWRAPWTDRDGTEAGPSTDPVFQLEGRLYPDGQEEILAAEMSRTGDRGWLRGGIAGAFLAHRHLAGESGHRPRQRAGGLSAAGRGGS